MAIDETLMARFEPSGAEEPVIRFYSWIRPAITAGYFQDIHSLVSGSGDGQKASQIVRRMTGGGMVLHGKDLTFSLVMKVSDPLISGDVKASYLKINKAVLTGLKCLFEELDFADCRTVVPSGRGREDRICFENSACYDVLKSGKKVVGASQRRTHGVLLHQSTVFLERPAEELESSILKGFEKKWGIKALREPLSTAELRLAKENENKRYSSPEWALTIP